MALTINSWVVGSVTEMVVSWSLRAWRYLGTYCQSHRTPCWDLPMCERRCHATCWLGYWNSQYELMWRKELLGTAFSGCEGTYTKPFPDHCEKKAKARIIRMRFLLPLSVIRLIQPMLAATSRSNWMAVVISWNSYSTRGSRLKYDSSRHLTCRLDNSTHVFPRAW